LEDNYNNARLSDIPKNRMDYNNMLESANHILKATNNNTKLMMVVDNLPKLKLFLLKC